MNNTFNADLKRGKIGENLVMETFKANGYEVRDVSKDCMWFGSDVDFISADGIKYEIKTDYRFQDTGNLALEASVYYKNSWEEKHSWFWNSEADYFIFVNPYNTKEFYSIKAKDLRHLIKTENIRRIEKDDGYKIITLYLFPLGQYIDCFEVIETNIGGE